MSIELDTTTYEPLADGEKPTALHIRCVPMLSTTLVEIVTHKGVGLDRPVLRIRGRLPYNVLDFPSLHQAIWTIGDELQRTANEMYNIPE